MYTEQEMLMAYNDGSFDEYRFQTEKNYNRVKAVDWIKSFKKSPFTDIKDSIKLMWHIPTNQVGQFLKETNPTGKPTTIIIKLFDGKTYFAPKSEFKSFSLDKNF